MLTFFPEKLSVYEIMSKNVAETIRRMRFACWIPQATDTLRIHNTYRFSTATMVK